MPANHGGMGKADWREHASRCLTEEIDHEGLRRQGQAAATQ